MQVEIKVNTEPEIITVNEFSRMIDRRRPQITQQILGKNKVDWGYIFRKVVYDKHGNGVIKKDEQGNPVIKEILDSGLQVIVVNNKFRKFVKELKDKDRELLK